MEYLVSMVLGGIASWIQKGKGKSLPSWARYVISFSSCFVISGGIMAYNSWSGGDFDLNELLASTGAAFVASQSLYNLHFKPQK